MSSARLSLGRRLLRRLRGAFAPGVLISAVLVSTVYARAPCTNQDFIGAFGFFGTGYVVKSPVTTLTGPFARLGRFESDGNGNLTFSSTANFNGFIFPQNFTGTYSVNSDCSYTAVVALPDPINLPVTFTGVVSDGGDETRDLFIDPPGVVVTGTARKQKLKDCTSRELSGSYLFEQSGSLLQPDGTRIPYSGLGRIEADGAGGFVGKLGSNFGGLPVQEDISGTYTVQQDCIFYLQYYTAGEGRTPQDGVNLKGVLIDGGTGAYLMVLDPNTATVLGSLKLQ